MSKFIDLKGKKYNRWTVLSLDRIENKKAYWLCQCECGKKKTICTANLKSGHSKSCGCLNREAKYKTHEKTNTRIYGIYNGIKTRCYNKNMNMYKYYGGRGIKMCDEWKNNFESFYQWSINNGYRDELTIDRIDVNKNYEPNNCRWIPMNEQHYNRTDNVYYIINNQKKCLAELCKEYNMPYQTVRKRLERGHDILYALTTPIDTKKRNKLYEKEENKI